MNPEKAIFTTHIDSRGRLRDGKEKLECPKCNGECYILDSHVTPGGIQHFTYNCTDCNEEWNECY